MRITEDDLDRAGMIIAKNDPSDRDWNWANEVETEFEKLSLEEKVKITESVHFTSFIEIALDALDAEN